MSDNLPTVPPLDSSAQVLPGFLDYHVMHNPDRPWVVFPSPLDDRVTAVSFKELSDATHKVAHALRPLSSPGGQPEGPNREIVAVLIHCDTILYSALLVGMIRAGLVPFPMSPKNSVPAIINLLKKTSCHRIIINPLLTPLLNALTAQLSAEDPEYALKASELPDLYDIFPSLHPEKNESNTSVVLPYPKVTENLSMDEPLFYLHSSGSTGFPKPIPQTGVAVLEACHTDVLKRIRGWACTFGSMALPTFHTMGIYFQVLSPFVTGLPIGMFAPQAKPQGQPQGSPVMPTPIETLNVCRRLGCGGLMIVPAFIEAWAQSEEDVKFLASMKFLAFAGGPLSERNGNKLVSAGVKLYMGYGATEFGAHTMVLDPGQYIPYYDSNGRLITDDASNIWSADDWSWIVFDPRATPRWVSQGDESFELEILTCDTHHPSVINLPDGSGYATSDLFVPHPTKKGLWRLTGRKDDVIVFGTDKGEKVVPLQQESIITSNAMVAGVVMFGRGRTQCGLLIEPHADHAVQDNEDALAKFRNIIWPAVEEANQVAPAYARIFKEMIIVTDSKRPLPRAAKGTIVRKQALDLYEKEIEKLYETVEDSANANGIVPPKSWSVEEIEVWLRQHSTKINGGISPHPTVDLFDQGLDSLQATLLRNRIIGALRSTQDTTVQSTAKHVTQNFVFDHPTLRELSEAIFTIVNGQEAGDKAVSAE